MKKALLTLLSSCLLISSAHANNFKNTDDAIEYRKAAFHLLSYQLKDMSAMVKGKTAFDAKIFAMRANNVSALAQLPLEGFIDGSDQGNNTEALPAIWKNKADFDAQMKDFQDKAAQLATVAQGGDMKKIKPVFAAAAKTCKTCHNDYKKD